MTVLMIQRFDSKTLEEVAQPIAQDEFGDDLSSILSSMAETMYGNRGLGLAGPQVGFLKRVLVADLGYDQMTEGSDFKYGNWIGMVNPETLEVSNETDLADEGCLSFPALIQKIKRPTKIRVKFFSPMGAEQEREFKGFQARIIQHEMDHLNGVTLLNRAGSLTRKSYLKKINKARESLKSRN